VRAGGYRIGVVDEMKPVRLPNGRIGAALHLKLDKKIGPVPDGLPRRSLQRVLCELLESEINAGLQTFAFDIVRVWIGDELNGFAATAGITRKDAAWSDDAAVAHWLHETAIRLYPESDYARAHRRSDHQDRENR